MRRARFWAQILGLSSACLATAARADEGKDWFDQDPDESTASKNEDDEEDEEEADDEAPQEEGEVDVGKKSGGYLTPGSIAFSGGVHLGMGGKLSYEASGLDSEDDLSTTLGLQLGGEYVLHDYFALGGELRLSGINTESASDSDLGRDLLTDIVVKPRGRYVFESVGVEAFVTLPLGLSIPHINADKAGDPGVGITFGAGLGASYFFTEKLGISSDLTWVWHWYGVEDRNIANNDKVEADIKLSQLYWFINMVYAL